VCAVNHLRDRLAIDRRPSSQTQAEANWRSDHIKQKQHKRAG
jgi:hypothetical protein